MYCSLFVFSSVDCTVHSHTLRALRPSLSPPPYIYIYLYLRIYNQICGTSLYLYHFLQKWLLLLPLLLLLQFPPSLAHSNSIPRDQPGSVRCLCQAQGKPSLLLGCAASRSHARPSKRHSTKFVASLGSSWHYQLRLQFPDIQSLQLLGLILLTRWRS